MTAVTRTLLLVFAAACASDGTEPDADPVPSTHAFGPYELAPGEEVTESCVQISLHNDVPLHVNSVELTTGPGFHHSNWFFVPEHQFFGEDGTWSCDDRGYNEVTAAASGGVLFAQSTQAPHEVQAFPPGVVVQIPPRSKIVAQIHLLNATDAPITLDPTITVTPIRADAVTTRLAAISFQNQAIALPPNMASRFSVECDLAEAHRELDGRAPEFEIYYALAHYHELGTGLTLEAVRDDGTATTLFTTEHRVGDSLGGPVEPRFDMTGYARLRMTCDYFNPRPEVVGWGVGDQEMCVFLAFSDSEYNWGGGVHEQVAPGNPERVGNTMTYSNPCALFAGTVNH